MVAWLLVEGYLQEDMHYTPYSVISYLVPGHRQVKKVKVKFINSKSGGDKSSPVILKEKSKKPKPKKRKIESSSESSDEEPDFGKVGKDKQGNADFDLGDVVLSSDEDFQ